MKNNNIIENILKKSKSYLQVEDEEKVEMWQIRIVSIRYRIYSIIMTILILIWIFNYALPKQEVFKSSKQSLESIKAEVKDFWNKQQKLQADIDLSLKIENWEKAILECINDQQWCEQIDPEIKKNFSEAVSYLQANSLTSEKMTVDEKMILKNINEYLTKENFTGSAKNWEINNIGIWDPTEFKDNLYYVSVYLNITFENKDTLLSFIHNIERKINPQTDLRILYKIDEISYDLMSYEEEQNVDIYLKAFYYK